MKEFNNIHNWLALTKEGEYITIDQVTDIRTDYYCPSCGEVLHGRALESELVDRHFYHLQNNNLESCNCEQAYKRYWKDRFISVGEVITLPFLKEITCISKEIDYKINDNLTADIYVKTENNDNVLILFDNNKQVQNSDLNYTIYYLNFMQLERDLTNINECLTLLHIEEINRINKDFYDKINSLANKFKTNLTKDQASCKVNINKYIQLQEELHQAGYKDEYIIIDCLINSLKNRVSSVYKYNNIIIADEEIEAVGKLVNRLKGLTNFNVNLEVKALKSINYKIYNKGYYNKSWTRAIYFDLIRPIGSEFNLYINKVENILNNNE